VGPGPGEGQRVQKKCHTLFEWPLITLQPSSTAQKEKNVSAQKKKSLIVVLAQDISNLS